MFSLSFCLAPPFSFISFKLLFLVIRSRIVEIPNWLYVIITIISCFFFFHISIYVSPSYQEKMVWTTPRRRNYEFERSKRNVLSRSMWSLVNNWLAMSDQVSNKNVSSLLSSNQTLHPFLDEGHYREATCRLRVRLPHLSIDIVN